MRKGLQPGLHGEPWSLVELSEDNLVKLLYIIFRGIPVETTGLDPVLCQNIPHLADCGLLRLQQGEPYVNLPIISSQKYKELDAVRVEQLHHLWYLWWMTKIIYLTDM